jgi:hypothetical protein
MYADPCFFSSKLSKQGAGEDIAECRWVTGRFVRYYRPWFLRLTFHHSARERLRRCLVAPLLEAVSPVEC